MRWISGKDLDRMFALINRIRAALPEEVDRASRITEESEKIISRARQEAEEEGESLPVKVLIPGSMKTRDSCANIAG